ncbi:MAG TPA: ubiquinone/menaquinone biosynthesis methyltransferase [Solirubrobacteraceae bacterium]|nr:ubiquinone/menaquinone biosynthesis methyltransferase [Solirubrobacteraceae bacterium]
MPARERPLAAQSKQLGTDAGSAAPPSERAREDERRLAQSGRLEAEQVRQMFDRVAAVYDVLNTTMTAGLHRRWRERAADFVHVGPGGKVLDVATGTGDLALVLARRVWPGGEVVASDFSPAMLARANAKAAAASGALVTPRFEWADAMQLPYEDDAFDAATVGFGARNFSDLQRGLDEMARVVRPGGRVVVLEITSPTGRSLPAVFLAVWFDRVVPRLGRLVEALAGGPWRARAREREGISAAYAYLPSSVKRFPSPHELAAEMARAGLGDIRYMLTAGGIIAIHAGTVCAEANA